MVSDIIARGFSLEPQLFFRPYAKSKTCLHSLGIVIAILGGSSVLAPPYGIKPGLSRGIRPGFVPDRVCYRHSSKIFRRNAKRLRIAF